MPSCATQGVVVAGAVVPGRELGGFEGAPGLCCACVPEPLFTGTHGATWLPGVVGVEVCATTKVLTPRAQLSKNMRQNDFDIIGLPTKNVVLSLGLSQELTVSSRLPRSWRVDTLFRSEPDGSFDGATQQDRAQWGLPNYRSVS